MVFLNLSLPYHLNQSKYNNFYSYNGQSTILVVCLFFKVKILQLTDISADDIILVYTFIVQRNKHYIHI